MPRPIEIQDTLTGKPRPLEPRDPGKVGIYACGPTVYAPIHVGNARPFVVFTLFKRMLEHEGYEATLVANVTDVNDKIYDAARANGVRSEQLAREMTQRYIDDTDRLELGRPDHEPKAAETVDAIVELIADLIESGNAYAAGGDVYFRVGSFPEYGKLSNRTLEDMVQTEDEDEQRLDLKEAPQDFALWKGQKEGEDTAWDAPWGRGRPGWHIECSAMAEEVLGVPLDVHGGGSDLIFPHHENEIAQTEAARHEPLAGIWMHNGMLEFEAEKMSKSVGNIQRLSDVIDEHGRDKLIALFIATHYRKPLGFNDAALAQAEANVNKVRELGRRLTGDGDPPADLSAHADAFWQALADDFNTPGAWAALSGWIGAAHRHLDAGERFGPGELREMLYVLGLDNLLDAAGDQAPAEAQQLLEQRQQARADKDYARADQIRDELAATGWVVRDTPEGARLVPKE
jgi:cysteinyl-tRNA synthetase